MATSISDGSASGSNRGSPVLVTSWCLVGLASLFVLARAAARRRLTKVEGGDVLLPVALIIAFTQTACVQLAVDNGLGQSYDSLEANAIETYYEIIYWAQLLYILILGITKTSIVLLVTTLQPTRMVTIGCWIASTIVVSSTLACLLASAFQCRLPNPWQPTDHNCINLAALQYALAAINIVTDLLVTVLPLTAIYLLPVNRETRWFVGTLCSSRFLVPIFTIVQMYWLRVYNSSTDPSIVTACVPSLGGLLTDMASGVTGRSIVLGDTELGRYSRHSGWRFSRNSGHMRMRSHNRENNAKLADIKDVERHELSSDPPKSSDALSPSRSKRRLSSISWLKKNKAQGYTIANNTPSQDPMPEPWHPERPERPDQPELRPDPNFEPAFPAPVLTNKSRESLTFDLLSMYAESNTAAPAYTRSIHSHSRQPSMHNYPNSMSYTNPSPAPSYSNSISHTRQPSSQTYPNIASHSRQTSMQNHSNSVSHSRQPSTHGRWSLFISNVNGGPTPQHSRDTSSTSFVSASSKIVSDPALVHSSAPVVPQRHPSRQDAIVRSIAAGVVSRPQTPGGASRPNTAGVPPRPPTSFPAAMRPKTAGNAARPTRADNDEYRPKPHASYMSHRNKVSDVSARSERFAVGEVGEESESPEQTHSEPQRPTTRDNGSFVDVDLDYAVCMNS